MKNIIGFTLLALLGGIVICYHYLREDIPTAPFTTLTEELYYLEHHGPNLTPQQWVRAQRLYHMQYEEPGSAIYREREATRIRFDENDNVIEPKAEPVPATLAPIRPVDPGWGAMIIGSFQELDLEPFYHYGPGVGISLVVLVGSAGLWKWALKR